MLVKGNDGKAPEKEGRGEDDDDGIFFYYFFFYIIILLFFVVVLLFKKIIITLTLLLHTTTTRSLLKRFVTHGKLQPSERKGCIPIFVPFEPKLSLVDPLFFSIGGGGG